MIEQPAVGVITRQAARPVEDGQGVVGVAVDADPDFDEVAAQRAFRQLQGEPAVAHGIVVGDNALVLHAEDVVPGALRSAETKAVPGCRAQTAKRALCWGR